MRAAASSDHCEYNRGIHLLHWLWSDFYTRFKPISDSAGMQIRGATLVSIGYNSVDLPEDCAPPDMAYYGSHEAARKYSAMALAKSNPITCPVLALHAQYDPQAMQATVRKPSIPSRAGLISVICSARTSRLIVRTSCTKTWNSTCVEDTITSVCL